MVNYTHTDTYTQHNKKDKAKKSQKKQRRSQNTPCVLSLTHTLGNVSKISTTTTTKNKPETYLCCKPLSSANGYVASLATLFVAADCSNQSRLHTCVTWHIPINDLSER